MTVFQLVTSSNTTSADKGLERELLEHPLSQARILGLVVSGGRRIGSVGIIPGDVSVPHVVMGMELLEPLHLSVVRVGGVRNKARARRSHYSGQWCDWEGLG